MIAYAVTAALGGVGAAMTALGVSGVVVVNPEAQTILIDVEQLVIWGMALAGGGVPGFVATFVRSRVVKRLGGET
jgi:hypothetical protein